MTATRLSFTDVLADEFEYFNGRMKRQVWTIEAKEIRELNSLTERLRAIREMPAAKDVVPHRYWVLNEACGRRIDESTVVGAMKRMLKKKRLLAELSKDRELQREFRANDSLLLRKLATVPQARRLLFDDRGLGDKVVADPSLVAIFTSRSAALQLIMNTGIADYLSTYPVLLSTIADSKELERYLLAIDIPRQTRRKVSLNRRRELIELLRPDPRRDAIKRLFHSLRSLFKPKDTPRFTQVERSELARNANALLAVLRDRSLPMPKGIRPPPMRVEHLARFNVFLMETAFADHVADGHDLRDLYSRIHQENVAALCLSGGGIRSATFNLGVLQGLASLDLLTHFHYISTVSGGGYIGSWLSSWVRRHPEGAPGVAKDLAAEPTDPLAPEVSPVQHLREYSSYLAPRGSALAVDTWTLVATYFRNLLLNWTMLIPALLATLALPRVIEALAAQATIDPQMFMTPVAIAMGTGLFSVIAIGAIRPSIDRTTGRPQTEEMVRRKRRAALLWLVPLLFSAIAFTTTWVALPHVGANSFLSVDRLTNTLSLNWSVVAFLFIAGNISGTALYLIRRAWKTVGVAPAADRPLRDWRDQEWRSYKGWRKWRSLPLLPIALWKAARGMRLGGIWSAIKHLAQKEFRQRALLELFGATLSGLLGGWFICFLFSRLFPPRSLLTSGSGMLLELYICTAIPLFLFVFFCATSLYVGLTTNLASEHDREWWARMGALIFLSSIAYLVVTSCVVLLPIAVMQLPKLVASLGGTAAITSWVLARGNRTAANAKEREVVGVPWWTTIALRTASIVLLMLMIAMLSLVTSGIFTAAGQSFGVMPVRARISLSLDDWNAAEGIAWHLRALRDAPWWLLGGFFAATLLIATLMSRALNVNVYSMHAMYRNRLVRAYLGASRWVRRPDAFTGFDAQDDLQMWQLRPEVIWPSAFPDFDVFLKRLSADDRVDGSPFMQLDPVMRAHILGYLDGTNGAVRNDLKGEVIAALNELMLKNDIAHAAGATRSIALFRRNRNFLDRYFAGFIKPMPVEHGKGPEDALQVVEQNIVVDDYRPRVRPPLHVVNMALNLVGGDKLAWRERKADSFTVTPLHSGNRRLGYRDSAEYGEGITLGTAMAISGAAVSPNMGYNSSPVVTFLMTLFNARLGWWLGNPGSAGQKTYTRDGPVRSLKSIIDEAFGRTHDKSKYVFLSDGGHFDNLGIYEMVLRRCRYIIACDASADRRYAFGDLANAVRKIRIDLGIEIELKSTVYIGPQENEKYGKYCALGYIRYDRVDSIDPGFAQAGYLVYIKPVVYNDCPTDVRHYQKENDGFPHESTVDQFFSESQFESYRALGRHVVQQVSTPMTAAKAKPSVFNLVRSASAYVEQQQPHAGDEKVKNVSDLVGWMQRSLS